MELQLKNVVRKILRLLRKERIIRKKLFRLMKLNKMTVFKSKTSYPQIDNQTFQAFKQIEQLIINMLISWFY